MAQRAGVLILAWAVGLSAASTVWAQSSAAAADQNPPHDHTQCGRSAAAWQFMQDGVVFANFNHQGGPRGGSEFVVPNWWMGMAGRDTGRGRVTLTGMFSLDPVTVGKEGYRELFQAGEALDGQPLIDRQHPHDFFMQLGAIWRIPVTSSTGLTFAGGPVGEPALGPVAFMHRPSAADNPTAPLGHHTFDSTHISFGVVTAAVDRGPFVLEGSVFNGREPDGDRWDFDFGPLDSFSGRVWFKPSERWEFQFSSGRLKDPEELEPGNIIRTTISGAWTKREGNAMSAWTAAFGRNDTDHGSRNAGLVEGLRRVAKNTIYGRFEVVQVENDADVRDPVLAFTAGAVREVFVWRGFEGGFGGDVTFYGVPEALRAAYSDHPVSFHVFFRLRPPAGAMGRMWNMRMSQPMGGNDPAAHHQMAMKR
jgi:hypothetical protein